MTTLDGLLQKLDKRDALIGVIGLGYVGLPLSIEFWRAGFRVIGFDIDNAKAERLLAGQSYITDVPAADVAQAIASGRFEATTDFGRLGEPDTLSICVPTPLDATRSPDLSYVVSTVEAIAKRLRKGQLIVLESTTYPGTTRDEMLPRLSASGMEVGTDFFCGFAPERVNPGALDPPFAAVPRVVSGVTESCLKATQALYEMIVRETVPVSSPEAAEMAKLLENIFRAVNISMVNELKMICLRMGIDVWEVIRAASTKPFGFMPFQPGPGLGGHCIPIDPFYLSWRARAFGVNARFIELAGEINTQMPEFVVHRVMEALNSHAKSLKASRILVLGASYKANVGDTRESPSICIMELLQAAGADVRYHDPYVPELPPMRHSQLSMESVELTESEIRGADCIVIATNHREYDPRLIAQCASLVVDSRNVMAGAETREGQVWHA